MFVAHMCIFFLQGISLGLISISNFTLLHQLHFWKTLQKQKLSSSAFSSQASEALQLTWDINRNLSCTACKQDFTNLLTIESRSSIPSILARYALQPYMTQVKVTRQILVCKTRSLKRSFWHWAHLQLYWEMGKFFIKSSATRAHSSQDYSEGYTDPRSRTLITKSL